MDIDYGKPLLVFIIQLVAYWIIPYYNYKKELYCALLDSDEDFVEEKYEDTSKND